MLKTAIKHKSRRFRRFLKANEAVSALEYAILVGVIADRGRGCRVVCVRHGPLLRIALKAIGAHVRRGGRPHGWITQNVGVDPTDGSLQ